MKRKSKPYGLLVISILILITLVSACSTRLGLGFGFGSGGSSLSLGVSTTLPREKEDVWEMQGKDLPRQAGQVTTLSFPKGGSSEGKVWGTDLYAEKSTIGVAAVHKGLITFAEGGTVTVRREAKSNSFVGSDRNGVESLSSERSSAAFSFVTEET